MFLSLKDCKATTVAWILSSHKLPSDRARELFNPSKEVKSLLASIKKIWLLSGLNFWGVMSWDFFDDVSGS